MRVRTKRQIEKVQESRFWNYIDATSRKGCWRWLGPLMADGRAQMGVTEFTKRMGTRRPWIIAWKLLVGEPEGELRRWCKTPNCCNPEHREEGDKIKTEVPEDLEIPSFVVTR